MKYYGTITGLSVPAAALPAEEEKGLAGPDRQPLLLLAVGVAGVVAVLYFRKRKKGGRV